MGKLRMLKPKTKVLKERTATVAPGSWRTSAQTSSQRGYGYKWQQARLVHLQQHPLCVYCERAGRVTLATVVDHSTPHRGDMEIFWDRSRWVSLCAHCHSSVKQKEENQQYYL
ncbi:HNH endonuclease signature motif containing protein [Pseudomonas oryzihabitans]|uniref:HNH endonuclease signature motif containing protein n=1 Tax=Pseudomonas oryzihabitans TaxID=47885 RepID=UPI0011A5C71A|nr:HNH endonuclease [Pseudomonas psychrotolerans]